jgi:hypothetical protein
VITNVVAVVRVALEAAHAVQGHPMRLNVAGIIFTITVAWIEVQRLPSSQAALSGDSARELSKPWTNSKSQSDNVGSFEIATVPVTAGASINRID